MWKVLFVENTTRCNLQCPGCKRPRTDNQDMSMEVYEATLSTFEEEPIENISFFWRGEPTLDKRLPKMVEMASERGYKTYVSTNSVTPLLHDENYVSRLLKALDRICFCVDGYDQKTLGTYRRGASWNTLIENLETIARIDADCHREMRTLMFKYNEGHEEEFVEVAKKYGMDVLYFGLPIINGRRTITQEEAGTWLANNRKYQRYMKSGDAWIHKSGSLCTMIPIISVTGEIAPCCYDWKIEHPLGNVLYDDIETINQNIRNLHPQAMAQKLSMCSRDCFLPNVEVNITNRLK